MHAVSWPLVRDLSPQLSSMWPPPPKALGDGEGVERRWLGHPIIQAPVRPRQWLHMYRGALQPGGSESGDTVRSLRGSPTSTVTTTDSTGR